MLLIQSILFFVLGVASASFLMLLLAPIIWRRALTLAHKAVRMEVPLSLHEVEAEYDFARAVHAVEMCRLEEEVARAKNHEMAARLALDMAQAQICYLTPFEEEAAGLQQTIFQMHIREQYYQQETTAQRLQLEKMTRLGQKNQREHGRIKAQKSMIKQLKRQISHLHKQLVRLEKQQAALEASAQARRQREQDERVQLSTLREEMKQMSAHIVAHMMLDQGEDSALFAMAKENAGSRPDDLAGAIHHSVTVLQHSQTKQEAQENL